MTAPRRRVKIDRHYREYEARGGLLPRAAWRHLWKLHMQYVASDRLSPYEGELLL